MNTSLIKYKNYEFSNYLDMVFDLGNSKDKVFKTDFINSINSLFKPDIDIKKEYNFELLFGFRNTVVSRVPRVVKCVPLIPFRYLLDNEKVLKMFWDYSCINRLYNKPSMLKNKIGRFISYRFDFHISMFEYGIHDNFENKEKFIFNVPGFFPDINDPIINIINKYREYWVSKEILINPKNSGDVNQIEKTGVVH